MKGMSDTAWHHSRAEQHSW